MQIELRQLRIDGGTEMRVAIDNAVVCEYAQALRGGAVFPPVVVFREGDNYWLTDGFHRYHAHRQAGVEKIEADVREGTLREALLYSAGANAEHGLRRSAADKRKAITTLLTHGLVKSGTNGQGLTDREIARLCRVDHKTVGRVRQELSGEMPQMDSTTRTVTRGGSQYVQDTSNIRRANQARQHVPAEPAASASPCTPGDLHATDEPVPMPTVAALRQDPRKCLEWLIDLFGGEYVRQVYVEMGRTYQDMQEREE